MNELQMTKKPTMFAVQFNEGSPGGPDKVRFWHAFIGSLLFFPALWHTDA